MNEQGEQFIAAPAEDRETLAALLRRRRPGLSWTDCRKLIDGRRVLVSGNLCLDPARRVKAGEVVKVLGHAAPPPPRPDDVAIHFLDEFVVVLEKPHGITTLRHSEERGWPAQRKQRQPTLDEILPAVVARHEQRPRARGKHGKPGQPTPAPRLRAVHRLDRDTSGLMMFARTLEAEAALGKQFRLHTVHRRYLTVCVGRLEGKRIESNLVRDRGDGRRGSAGLGHLGQHAVTHVKPVEFLGDFTLAECRLETGRTHQIRIHLSEACHPVCGEKVYTKPLDGPVVPDTSGAPRLALHAAELGFVHPVTGQNLVFQTPLPSDLARLVEILRTRRDRGVSSG